MTIGCRVDGLEVRAGGAIDVNTIIRNDSRILVHAMDIMLEQQTTWRVRDHTRSKKRTLRRTGVLGSQLSVTEHRRGAEALIQRRQSEASIAEAARQDVRQQLAAGDGTHCRISVPRSALLSVEIASIEVRHWLIVKLQTASFSLSPELSIPVHVRPPETAARGEATASPCLATVVEMGASGDDTPGLVPVYAATVVEVGNNGDDMPESVPVCAATVVEVGADVDGMPASAPVYTATPVVEVG